MKKHNVLHLIASGGLYGAESVILNLSSELKCTEFNPIVGMIHDKKERWPEIGTAAEALGIDTKSFPLRFKFDPSGLLLLKKYISAHQIEIVHSHGYKSTFLSFFPAIITKIPLIATCHLWANKGDLKLKIYHEMEAAFMKFLPAIVGVSDEICTKIIQKGINSDKVKLIPNGIDINSYKHRSTPTTISLSEELDIKNNDFVVGTLGRLNWQKAHHFLLDAVKILKNKSHNVKCVIFGDGPSRNELEEKRDQLGLQGLVYFPGFSRDIIEALKFIDIFVLTSVDEGLPMVLLEAMAMKKPIVTTPVGEINKVIHHSVNGFIYPVGDITALVDHIIELQEDKGLRKRLGDEACKTFEKHYTSKIMAVKYVDVYKSLL